MHSSMMFLVPVRVNPVAEPSLKTIHVRLMTTQTILFPTQCRFLTLIPHKVRVSTLKKSIHHPPLFCTRRPPFTQVPLRRLINLHQPTSPLRNLKLMQIAQFKYLLLPALTCATNSYLSFRILTHPCPCP